MKKSILILMIVLIFMMCFCLNVRAETLPTTKWNLYFENIEITEGSVTATTAPVAAATDKKTTLTYAIGNLTLPGQFYEFTVDVKNGGSVDAKLDAVPVLEGVDTNQDVYTNFTFTNEDGTAVTAGQVITAGASKKYRVRVEYDPNVNANQLPTSAQDLTLTVTMNWVQN